MFKKVIHAMKITNKNGRFVNRPYKKGHSRLTVSFDFYCKLLLNCVNADLLAVFAHTLELNCTVDESEESVI